MSYIDIMKEGIDKDLCKKGWANCTAVYLKKLRKREFNDEYADIVFQDYRGKITIYDAYAFMQVHAMRCSGKLAMVRVYVGAGPSKDEKVKENNEILFNMPDGFKAFFEGGKGVGDGQLRWEKDITLDMVRVRGDKEKHELLTIGPGAAVLEVGYTNALTTLYHLSRTSLARWPYGQEWITLMKKVG